MQVLSEIDVGATGSFIDLTPPAASPAAPSTDLARLFARRLGGRVLPSFRGLAGAELAMQPFVGESSIAEWRSQAGTTTAPTAHGIPAPSATGTATAATTGTTNRYSRMRKTEYLVTTASSIAVAGFRAIAGQWTIGADSAGDGGFFYVCRWGAATGVATATNRAFVGMGPTAVPTDVEPSSITNQVGMGWDAADTNIQVIVRGAGSVAKIDTGIPVPTVDRTSAYQIAMFSPPGTTQKLYVQVRNLTTGAVFNSGEITANLPSTTTQLAPRGWMSVGGTSSVIGISLTSMYLETDY